MKIKNFLSLATLLFVSVTQAAPITDVKNHSNNSNSEFFVDTDANKNESPYYRGSSQSWSWQHNSVSGTFTSAVLNISAFDVDTPYENDLISIWTGSNWFSLGELKGNNQTWSFTEFDLTSMLSSTTWLANELNAGLQVKIKIEPSWLVTLAKSTLSLDGGNQVCVPQPGQPCQVTVPEPVSLALLGLGLAGFGFSRRKNKNI